VNVFPGLDFIKEFTPTLEICALHPSFLYKFTLIWHYVFAPCAQFFAFSPRFWLRSTLYALRPTFMKSTPGVKEVKKMTLPHDQIISRE
jgi:hypothetical protein